MGILRTTLFYSKVAMLLASGRVVTPSAIEDDYDSISEVYDEHFADKMKKHTISVIVKLGLFRGCKFLDLGCGTGSVAIETAKIAGEESEITGIDISSGMIEIARKKASDNNYKCIRFYKGDILKELRTFPSDYFDFVIFGQRVMYYDPRKVISQINRVLRPRGALGVIINTKDSFIKVRDAAFKVAKKYPQDLKYIINTNSNLPENASSLKDWFNSTKYDIIDIWDGNESFNFNNGRDVLEWFKNSGISAGINQITSPEAREKWENAFIEQIERMKHRKSDIKVIGNYVAGIAQKKK